MLCSLRVIVDIPSVAVPNWSVITEGTPFDVLQQLMVRLDDVRKKQVGTFSGDKVL